MAKFLTDDEIKTHLIRFGYITSNYNANLERFSDDMNGIQFVPKDYRFDNHYLLKNKCLRVFKTNISPKGYKIYDLMMFEKNGQGYIVDNLINMLFNEELSNILKEEKEKST